MTINEFKIKYSELMQLCMYLEDELRRYYALIKDKNDLKRYMDIWKAKGKDSMGSLIKLFYGDNCKYITSGMYVKLKRALKLRNYYAHELFLKNPIKHKVVQKKYADDINKHYEYINFVYEEVMKLYDKRVVINRKIKRISNV